VGEQASFDERTNTEGEELDIPESDEEWDPDTSWLQSYAPAGFQSALETEAPDTETDPSNWRLTLASQRPDEERFRSLDSEQGLGWNLPADPESMNQKSGSDGSEEAFTPRDPKKETAFWRGAAQELMGHQGGSASTDSSEEAFPPRDPKKETAFWRGAAQDLIEGLTPASEKEADGESAPAVSSPGASMYSGLAEDTSSEAPFDAAEAWSTWRSMQRTRSPSGDTFAPTAETEWDMLPEEQRWGQWREQQKKSWAGALDDLNRRHPLDRQKPLSEKSTIDRWRNVASEFWSDKPNTAQDP
jgi:hypothetical protein